MRMLGALAVLAAILGAPAARGAASEAPASGKLHLGADFSKAGRALLDKHSQFTYLGASALFFAARGLDNDARVYFAGQRREGDLAGFGNEVLGTGVPGALLGFGAWLKGASQDLPNSQELIDFGQANLEAMLATAAVTTVLKGTVKRERPDHSDHYSFPSGHTSTVAATAMTIYEFYGWRAGVPAFLLTAVTAVGRMTEDRHWLSDTVGGATIGVLFGHAFAVAHRGVPPSDKSAASRGSWMLLPAFEADGTTLLQARRFF